jgi:hypothetical protein
MRFGVPNFRTFWRNRVVEGEGGQNARWTTAKFERFSSPGSAQQIAIPVVGPPIRSAPAVEMDRGLPRHSTKRPRIFHLEGISKLFSSGLSLEKPVKIPGKSDSQRL